MKKHVILSILGILVLCGCDRTIWDTSRGNMSVSFRVDGTRYVCAVKNELVESPLRVAFYDSRFLDFHVDGFDRKTGCPNHLSFLPNSTDTGPQTDGSSSVRSNRTRTRRVTRSFPATSNLKQRMLEVGQCTHYQTILRKRPAHEPQSQDIHPCIR